MDGVMADVADILASINSVATRVHKSGLLSDA
jgi:hypothetical protein